MHLPATGLDRCATDIKRPTTDIHRRVMNGSQPTADIFGHTLDIHRTLIPGENPAQVRPR
jgi:hypothetical protein